MMHVPHRMIAIALHVMLGTVIRTTSWFVLVDHTRISLLPQVRNRSEHSLKSQTNKANVNMTEIRKLKSDTFKPVKVNMQKTSAV